MSERSHHRRPATFKLDDPGVIVMDPDDTGRPARGTVHITPEPDPALLPVPIDMPLVPVRRGFRWGTVFWTAVGGLVLLGTGLGVVNLIEDLFSRSERLGFLGLAFASARAALQAYADDIIDGADMIKLAERELMSPLDQEARRLVSTAAQRVSIVTAVSPRALIDVLFVFAASLRLIRQLARLYR